MKALWISIVAAALVGCATSEAQPVAAQPDPYVGPISDAELGLDKNGVFATPTPVAAKPLGAEPGANQTVGAYFSESPPPIPHVIEALLPITGDSNQCLDCHDARDQIGKEIAAGDATPMPASHYTDLRRAPQKVTDSVIGARFNCDACHVARTDAVPLVANTYR